MRNPLRNPFASWTPEDKKKPWKPIGRWFVADESNKGEDGRDQFQSRASYVLASMCGAVGFGNLLRFPSQVFNNNGLQWFIPYFLALAVLAIPVLILEVALGSSFRGGPVIAYNAINKRSRGAGLGNLWVASLVFIYYVPMLAWVLKFFRGSFESPLPWDGRLQEYWQRDVLQNVIAVPATAAEAIEQGVFQTYPGTALVAEHVGWTIFSYFITWLCLCRGIQGTGKVVYFTVGVPIIMIFVLIIRGATLPNAIDGIRLYVGEFNADQLVAGQIWQDALGQVFYSTGVGFGYYTAYASYNAQNANAVQDAIIICCSNSLFEITCGFAVFCIVGFLGLTPESQGEVGSFELGFITLPAGLAEMPGSNAWAVIFFFTLFVLAVSSCFVMLDSMVTAVADTDRFKNTRRVYITTAGIAICFLLSLLYNSEFGPQLLDGIDLMTNNIVLPFTVFAECYGATVLYRSVDVVGQVGVPAFLVHQLGYIGGMLVGLVLAHNVGIAAGVGAGFGMYVGLVLLSVLIGKSPDSKPPRFWCKNVSLERLWWLAFYSGNQLKRDLNVTVKVGKNWPLTWYWAICLRYISCPALAIVFSFSYPSFMDLRTDPLTIFPFAIAHFAIFTIASTLVFPRWMAPLIPAERQEEGKRSYAPQVVLGVDDVRVSHGIEAGSRSGSDVGQDEKLAAKKESDDVADVLFAKDSDSSSSGGVGRQHDGQKAKIEDEKDVIR